MSSPQINLQINGYKADGIAAFTPDFIDDYLPFLRRQLALLYESENKVRPWDFWELHNPWSRSARKVDSWKFLDLCQLPKLLELITPLIGNDIILHDSQFSPDLSRTSESRTTWATDQLRYPLAPLSGLVVRIPFCDSLNEGVNFVYQTPGSERRPQSLQIQSGRIICHDIRLRYQVAGKKESQQPFEYVIRYFPATSCYLRDPAIEAHRILTEQYPLLNYAQMPLWLVQGEDKANNDFVTGFQPKGGRWIESE